MTVGFEISLDHPYKFLVEIIKRLVHKRQVEFIDSKDANSGSTSNVYNLMLNRMVQYSMNFANDSMQTSLCLQFEPQKIATACVYLAGQFARVRPTVPSGSWLEVLGYRDVESLASISLQIIELVAERKATDQKLFDKIRADLEELKEEKASPPPGGSGTGEPNSKRQRTG